MSPLPPQDAALHILRELRLAGHVAYFAGGCVRDLLLGLTPKDYDIATSAPPAEVKALFRNSHAVGAAFGVILVRYAGHQIEVATFRSDGSYSDGRRPDSVRFASPEEDALRRDFTINGLFLDPLHPNPDAAVIDFVGGRADLHARVLRAIGDPARRFAEDHLRLLRAVRFAARFNFHLDPRTAAAIRLAAPHLRRIAPERIGDELRRMLTPASRTLAWPMLRDLGLTAELFRYCSCPDRPMLSLIPHLPTDDISFPLALAAAALEESVEPTPTPHDTLSSHDTALLAALQPHPAAALLRGLRQSLRLSNEETHAISELFHNAHALLTAPHQAPPVALRRRVLAMPHAPDLLRFLRTLAAAGHFPTTLPPLLADLTARQADDNAPPPLLTGDHLTAAGLRPGPLFRRLLADTYDAQLEGRLSTSADALAHALALAKHPPTASA